MKKLSVLLIAMVIFTLAISACAPAAPAAEEAAVEEEAVVEEAEEAEVAEEAEAEEVAAKEPIKIGNLQDESGGMKALSSALTYAATMKIEEVNAAGGINGHPIELITYDTRSDVNEAINAYTRMVEQDEVIAVLGPPISNIGIAVAPVAEELQVPISGLFMDENAIFQESGEPWHYMFLGQNSAGRQGMTIAAYLMQEKGLTDFAFLYNNQNSYSVGLKDGFEQIVTENGGTVTASETYVWEDKDFRAQLTKILATDPECIYFPSYPVEIPLIYTQAYELGYTGVMAGSNSVPPTGLAPQTDPAATTNSFYPYAINVTEPELQEWAATYEEKFGVKPLAQSFSGADAFGMLLQAIEAAGEDLTPARITEELNTVSYEGFQGTVEMSPDNHQPKDLPMAIFTITEGAAEYVMWYLPTGPAE